MTVFLPVPLQESTATPSFPPFLCPASEPADYWKKVIKAILKAKHIAVVCGEHLKTTQRRTPHFRVEYSCLHAWRVLGAGISVQAGIPDFRSSNGLFQTLKKDNPSLSSGRDLFDASVFKVSEEPLGGDSRKASPPGFPRVSPTPSRVRAQKLMHILEYSGRRYHRTILPDDRPIGQDVGISPTNPLPSPASRS